MCSHARAPEAGTSSRPANGGTGGLQANPPALRTPTASVKREPSLMDILTNHVGQLKTRYGAGPSEKAVAGVHQAVATGQRVSMQPSSQTRKRKASAPAGNGPAAPVATTGRQVAAAPARPEPADVEMSEATPSSGGDRADPIVTYGFDRTADPSRYSFPLVLSG